MCTDDSNHTNTKYVKKIMTCTEDSAGKRLKWKEKQISKKYV